ncbi:hypothetical protein AB0J20_26820 [Micromonospora costi]|uniref:hypothetical protein n=1 Tax=Micromonospora costi TaxID=1530042 RepID=UPI0033E897C2
MESVVLNDRVGFGRVQQHDEDSLVLRPELHPPVVLVRWRAVNAPHLVALVRAGATFIGGHLVERSAREGCSMTMGDSPQRPTDKLAALRLGRRLVTEVSASGPGRRAFVDIRPITTAADTDARRQGWTRSDRDRTFKLEHWDYDANQITGFDYDIGAVLVKAATVTGEAQLAATLETWNLRPEQFLHPWQTDDPK